MKKLFILLISVASLSTVTTVTFAQDRGGSTSGIERDPVNKFEAYQNEVETEIKRNSYYKKKRTHYSEDNKAAILEYLNKELKKYSSEKKYSDYLKKKIEWANKIKPINP